MQKQVYSIIYDINGGEGVVPEIQYKKRDQSITLSAIVNNLYKAGFTFKGWNTQIDGNGITYADGDDYSINKDLILYAVWEVVII